MPTFTSGNDTYLVHTAGTFDLDMLAGDDTLTVQGGTSTTAHMGDGNDVVQLKSGLANVFGDAGADRFEVYAVNAIIDAGADDDLINIRGGSGISAGGGLGDDRFNIYAGSTSLTLDGGDGDDDFFGYFHAVTGTINGGAGNDYFVEFVGGVTIRGGDGNDIYRADPTGPATFLELSGQGTDSVQVARGASYTLPANIENISVQGFHGSTTGVGSLTGNALNNHITAHNNNEVLFGLDGNDSLSGKGGIDTLSGGNGNDFLDGGTGNDVLDGGAGSDVINGRTGDDWMGGGTGDDTYYVDSLSDTIVEDASHGTDTVRSSVYGYALPDNVENGIVQSGVGGLRLFGNELANILTGNSGNDIFESGGGNDTLKGGGGDDQLYGHAGDDVMIGGAGDDLFADEDGSNSMYGGIGDDTYILRPGATNTIVENAGEGTDVVVSELGEYTLLDNFENGTVGFGGGTMHGNGADNVLTSGFADADVLDGLSGDDTLNGNAGNDTLYGGEGDDVLNAGAGSDMIYGGLGQDLITTGAGSDIVRYDQTFDALFDAVGRPNDEITDFDTNTDFVWLLGIDADTNTAGVQSFHFTGSTWDQTVGDVWLQADGAGGDGYFLYAEVNGDQFADMAIHLILPSGINSFGISDLII